MSTGNFEAKLHAYRRTQDGAVISFTVHPDEIRNITELSNAPFGTRIMIGWAEIGDDEKPKHSPVAQMQSAAARGVAGGSPAGATKQERRAFASMSLPAQAGMRCGESQFHNFIVEQATTFVWTTAADYVRSYCGVTSRAELATNPAAADKWRELEAQYQSYITDLKYAGATRG